MDDADGYYIFGILNYITYQVGGGTVWLICAVGWFVMMFFSLISSGVSDAKRNRGR